MGHRLPGALWLEASRYDADSTLLHTASAPLLIGSGVDGPLLGAHLATDRPAYASRDMVRLAQTIANHSHNTLLDGLRAVTQVRGPDGAQHFMQATPLGQLGLAGVRQLPMQVTLDRAPAGPYVATLSVLDGSGVELASSQAHFLVQSDAETGVGLAGSITADPALPEAGAALRLDLTLHNQGSAALADLDLAVWIVHPESGERLAELPARATLAAGATHVASIPWTVQGAPGDALVAVLVARLAGAELTLAQTPFTIAEPTARIDIELGLPAQARVLALAACAGSAGGNGPADGRCDQGRAQALAALLTQLGVAHTVTTDAEEFRRELRRGAHNVYWLSGKLAKMHDDLALEVREAVWRGEGLVLDGEHDQRNKALDDATGIRWRGKIGPTDLHVAFADPVLGTGSLPMRGRGQRVELAGSRALAHFDDRASSPAILAHAYGQGRAALYAFDFVETWQALPAWAIPSAALLDLAVPAVPPAQGPGAWVPVWIDLRNEGAAVEAGLRLNLPPGATMAAAHPAPLPMPDGPAGTHLWRLPMPAGTQRTVRLALRTPADGQPLPLQAQPGHWDGERFVEAGAPATLTIAIDPSPLDAEGLRATLDALAVSGPDRPRLDRVRLAVMQAQTVMQQAHWAHAIDAWLQAAAGLADITSADTAAARLWVVRALQVAQWRWSEQP